ncbi:hypothetical protein AVEN_184708-1 [Araneus ventricosus]|uniref:Uncharacterized protein n=1 Tax=Araneus ventricosus TaxID=182803 RepID=A0A4Y2BP19_ARAVE|nr:hypothetical protein AVEN_177150-1 [Araneus ventricosus]GBL93440.1 hypothetical protein AVEN_184708-1 [Araneus ventricosus]
MFEAWQTLWKNGGTGRKIYEIMPSVSLRPTNRIREDVIFSQHDPFPAYLKRFHLSDSDYCSCGGIGTALHYATECIYTVSWHMRKPLPNFEQEWLKRVANNLVSRHKNSYSVKLYNHLTRLFIVVWSCLSINLVFDHWHEICKSSTYYVPGTCDGRFKRIREIPFV